MTKKIPLTQGKEAIVDDDLYEYLSQWKWFYNGGYAGRHVGPRNNRKRITLHRFVMNAQPGEEIDHINLDRLDCRRTNLRRCTRSQNMANKAVHGLNKTGYKGVYYRFFKKTGSFIAQIKVARKQIYIGSFDNPIDAAHAYDVKAKELFGDFARVNFPAEVA